MLLIVCGAAVPRRAAMAGAGARHTCSRHRSRRLRSCNWSPGALFVENVLAAMILGLLTAIWLFGDSGERRYFYLAMALGGAA